MGGVLTPHLFSYSCSLRGGSNCFSIGFIYSPPSTSCNILTGNGSLSAKGKPLEIAFEILDFSPRWSYLERLKGVQRESLEGRGLKWWP